MLTAASSEGKASESKDTGVNIQVVVRCRWVWAWAVHRRHRGRGLAVCGLLSITTPWPCVLVPLLCRPLNDTEKREGEVPVVTVSPAVNEIAVLTAGKRGKTYSFDKVCVVAGAFNFCRHTLPVVWHSPPYCIRISTVGPHCTL